MVDAEYKCNKDNTNLGWVDLYKPEIKKYIAAYAQTYGLIATTSDVIDGLKVDLAPSSTPLGINSMGYAAQVTIEMRKLGRDILGIQSTIFGYGHIPTEHLEVGSDFETIARTRIENMLGVPSGSCQLR